MTDSKEVKFAKEIDYKAKAYSYPEYKFQKATTEPASTNINIKKASGDIEMLINIPANKAVNLAESYINYTLTLPAGGAGNYTHTPIDTVPEIRVIELMTTDGVKPVQIEDFNNYMSVVRVKETQISELLTLDRTDCLMPAADANVSPNGASSNKLYVDPLFVLSSGNNAALVLYRKFKLGYIPYSVFSYGKDLVFPQVLQIRILFNGAKVSWIGTDPADSSQGPAAAPEFADNAISNFACYLAIEQNMDIVKSLQDKVKTGMTIPIHYVKRFKQPVSAATNQSVTHRITKDHGQKLQKVIHTVFPAAETLNASYDHNNFNADAKLATKITQYRTTLNSLSNTSYDINCPYALGDDWLLHRNRLKGSSITSQKNYMLRWFHEDDFTNAGSVDSKNNETLIAGLDLSEPVLWSFEGIVTANAAFNHYSFAVTQRVLSISNDSITIA